MGEGGGQGGGSPGEQEARGVRETGEKTACYCLHPVKETNPQVVLEIKKKKKTALLPVKLETFSSRLYHRT